MGLRFKMIRKNIPKKAQSGVIGAVLLILIVIIAAMVVIGFIIPFIREKLEGGECVKVAGEMEIKNNLQYTCYNSSSKSMRVQIHYGDIENLTKGFQISIGSSGGSESFEVYPGTSDNVTMFGVGTIELPGKNEERTYVLGGVATRPETVELYAILKNGKACDPSDSLTSISLCY